MKSREKLFFWGSIAFFLFLVFLIWFFGRNWLHDAFLADKGPAWYYWKLPIATLGARISGWGLFIAHLSISWFLLYKAKKESKYGVPSKYNYLMLGTHILFSVLHLVQTSIWYDSLAHDTPVWLSQYSVILMLVLIMILVNKRRGLFFGKKLPIPEPVYDFVRKYHSYYILLSLTFTFWYHPMEITPGHLVGFFYMFLLFLQSSLMFTKTHLNKYWIFILEIMVLIHGTIIAIAQGTAIKDVWPLFAFGFGFIAVCTQIYILNLSKFQNFLIQSLYLLFVFFVYSGVLGVKRTFGQIYEIIFIPFTEYGIVLLIVGLGFLLIWGKKIFKK